MSDLRKRAQALLTQNDRGRYTVPSPHLYPHQWAWDSAFAAIGWATFDPERALVELETLMAGQWSDGRIPHIQFHDQTGDYYPDPSFWRTERTSSITQPPMWAPALLSVLGAGGDRDRIRALLPAVESSHEFFLRARDPKNIDLVTVVHPWESGLDNAPQWDPALAAVDTSRAIEVKRVDKDKVGSPDQRPTDEQYVRYSALVQHIADNDFGPGSFQVYDPFMASVLVLADEALAKLSTALSVETRAAQRADRVREALVKHLWMPEQGRFGFLDASANILRAPDVLAAHFPLVIDPPAPVRSAVLEQIKTRYQAEWPLPTVAPGSDLFEAVRYWRGPTWINMNWFFAAVPEFSQGLTERTLKLMDTHGFCEYYHPESGHGLGAPDFTWSAALCLDLLRQAGA